MGSLLESLASSYLPNSRMSARTRNIVTPRNRSQALLYKHHT